MTLHYIADCQHSEFRLWLHRRVMFKTHWGKTRNPSTIFWNVLIWPISKWLWMTDKCSGHLTSCGNLAVIIYDSRQKPKICCFNRMEWTGKSLPRLLCLCLKTKGINSKKEVLGWSKLRLWNQARSTQRRISCSFSKGYRTSNVRFQGRRACLNGHCYHPGPSR